MKYPIGIQSFNRIIEDDYVYVDKRKLFKVGTVFSSDAGIVSEFMLKL